MNQPIFLIGNKSDLRNKINIPDLKDFSQKYCFDEVKISIKDSIGVSSLLKKFGEIFNYDNDQYFNFNQFFFLLNDKELKITELKEQIKKLNESLSNYQKIKTDLENIALKQEDKINELGYKVTKIETILKNKNLEIKQNEDYAVQLMNIIKEQKVQMQNLVNNNQEKENDLIKSLKNNIENLKNSIEIKENTIQTIQKSHKILQDKFLKLCSDKRKKEQEDLLIQAKEMKIKKNEREKGNLSINRNNSKNKNKKNNKEENKNNKEKINNNINYTCRPKIKVKKIKK